jgi:hypothetical protein
VAKVLIVSESYGGFQPDESGHEVATYAPGRDGLPSLPALLASDVIVVLEHAGSADLGTELGGTLSTALARGKLVIVAYKVRVDSSLGNLLERVGVEPARALQSGVEVEGASPAFAEYFTRYGISANGFAAKGDNLPTDVLALLPEPTLEGRQSISAARFEVGDGRLYLLPFHVANLAASHNVLVDAMLDAVMQHEAASGASADALPDYVDALRLPDEEKVLGDIERLEADLADAQQTAQRLRSYRALLGTSSGGVLERLSIDALSVVLEGSGYVAEDREEEFAEDFWLVGPDGDFALVEAKGINSSVRRSHVNQVDDHRGQDDGEPPGLLVVNTHRLAGTLALKQEEIHPDIRAHAVRQNVLILTGFDLYGLLGIALAGGDAATPLLEGLSGGGGWLRVREGTVEVVKE